MRYWLVALAFTAFGVLGGFSIGAPFFLIGATLLVLGPIRRRERIFAPALLGVIGFAVATFLLVPFACSATSTVEGGSVTVCTSLAGATWTGAGLYNPPPEAFAAAGMTGMAVGGTTAILTAAWLTLRGRRGAPWPH